MDTLRLVRPGMEHLSQIADFRRELLDAGSSMDGCGPLIRMEDPMEWLLDTQARSRLETLPEGRVLSTQLLCMRGDTLVGMIQVRHILNEYLEKYAGHIGYGIRPSLRGRHYAPYMLGLGMEKAKEKSIEKALLCCEEDNPASARTIEDCGGKLENIVEGLRRYWITV